MAMPVPPAQHEWTVDDLHALPDDDNRYELIDGKLFVSPAAGRAHQRASRELVNRLAPYVASLGDIELLYAPFAVNFSARTEVQPDLLVLPLHAQSNNASGQLQLVVEILSPSTARVDRARKRALYQQQRIPEYWIVDVAACLVERWRPQDAQPEVIFELLVWQPKAEVEALVIDLRELFRVVYGE